MISSKFLILVLAISSGAALETTILCQSAGDASSNKAGKRSRKLGKTSKRTKSAKAQISEPTNSPIRSPEETETPQLVADNYYPYDRSRKLGKTSKRTKSTKAQKSEPTDSPMRSPEETETPLLPEELG
jgi:hypothetical protein